MSFSFKQFNIQQDKSAMKVCTDACLFGAWVAEKFESEKIAAKRILDIGTGTGLLSLMLAQKTNAKIDALEINADAAEQALQNFNASPWKETLHIITTDAVVFESPIKYDFIISNPPFYEADLHSPDKNKNAAKHDSTLTFAQLIKIILSHLSHNGLVAVLIPHHRSKDFTEQAAAKNLFTNETVLVHQTPGHNTFRTMLLLSRQATPGKTTRFIIHTAERNYTPEFISLLKDYYLKL